MIIENHITKVQKRNGDIVEFMPEKISNAIFKAITATKQGNGKKTQQITESVIKILNRRFQEDEIPNVEQIQDIVEEVLILEGETVAAKAFILYREQRRKIRESQLAAEEAVDRVDDYLEKLDWEVQENSNMTFSLQGLNHYGVSYIVKKYWLNKIYPSEVREANESGDIHLHNLDTLACYCVGWDLYDLLLQGFGGVNGKIESSPPKHFRSALGQVVNFMYTLQGEAAGAVSFSNFDTLLAPFIRYDNLSYAQVEQAIQEFLYNMAVPTRVGFQCLSEDTEILTPDGWMGYEDVKKGDKIKTFNLKTGEIEDKEVLEMFKRDYKGEMYNLKNRIQDQLISPEHRVVRKSFNSNNFVLESIEDVSKLKSPFIIPIAGENNKEDAKISDEQIKLMAWIIAEGTVEKPGDNYRSSYRVSIYQSKIKNKKNYDEIISLLDYFKLKYSIFSSASLGENVERMRLDANSSKKIHGWFKTRDNIHFIPDILFNMSQRQSQLFLETYLEVDGTEDCKIATADEELLNGLQAVAVNAGYGFTVRERKPTIGKKIIYILRLIKYKETYIQTVKKVKYDGVIWCPTTKNETVIARRNGKVFITGNCPFTNITLDLKPASTFANQSVIIGGVPQKETYSEFEEEMKMLNKAFYTTMIKGDKSGRPFSFPIPTINITPDFPWDDPALDPLFEASAKYGINYFANYVNSDMKPEDARSMCLYEDEDILIKENEEIKKLTVRELFDSYGGEKLDEEWRETKKNIKALSLNPDTGKTEWADINKLLKIKDKTLITIEAQDGKTMKVSKDHLVGVYTEEGIKTKKAKDVTADDLLLVLKDASDTLEDNKTIDRWNLNNGKIEKLRSSDFAVVGIKSIQREELDFEAGFYDLELEKNHYFVHSQGNITHNCCRLRLDMTQLANRGGGGLFGSGSLTGSIGVVTINLPRIGYLSKTKKEFFQRLEKMMDIAKESLEIKRKTIEEFASKGLYPYSKHYLSGVKKARGQYFANHFSTIGICGMNEALLNFMGEDIGSKKGRTFTLEVMDFMREVLVKYQRETNNLYNLEATPAESTSYRLAQKDRKLYPNIITAGTRKVPYYTNSTQLPVNYTDDIFEEVRLQDDIQCKYTGGTVEHIFIGEEISDIGSVKSLIKKIFEKNRLPYITITPTFSICPIHGYIAGKHFTCPKCAIEQPCEVYSRVVGYLRPVSQWNEGKQQEFKDRKEFKQSLFKK